MAIEMILLFSTMALLIALALLLLVAAKEHKPKRRFKVREDIQRIKDQISQ